MAISALESTNSSSPIRSPGSPRRGTSSCRLSINNAKGATIKTSKSIKLPLDSNSPYLIEDKVHVKSRVTGKTFLSKKEESFSSSFPMAAKIYRANSDEFQKMKRYTKKTKKSVLTLPNVQAPKQQECTVSDTNDSELFKRVENQDLQPKWKRSPAPKKKTRSPGRRRSPSSQVFGYSADSSSIEMINHFDGDVSRKKKNISDRQNSMYRAKAYDVWTMLRNMNRFQFKPSPAISEESVVITKKTKVNRKHKSRKDPRVIQTRRAEEVQYISNFDIETLSPSNSFCRASSSGRVTVIDKNDPFEDLCKEFQERIEHIERVGFSQDQPWTNKNKRKNKKSPKKIKVGLKKDLHVIKPVQEKMPNIPYDFPFMANNSGFSNNTSKITLQSEQSKVNNSHYNLKLTTKPQTVDCIYTATVNNNKSKPIQRKLTESIYKKTKNVANENIKMCKSPIQSTENISCISGITQVVLNKGKLNTQRPPQRSLSPFKFVKSRPTTTSRYQNSTTIPSKAFEVRRSLARLKFPITILGQGQLSSTYEVVTLDAPQFEGLGEKIWPFMTDWYKDPKERNNKGISKKVNKVLQYCWNRKPEEAKWNPKTCPTSMKKTKDSLATVNSGTTPRTPMGNFKDKMLKFLHKNPANNNELRMQATDSKIIRNSPKDDSIIDVKCIENNKPTSPVIRSRTSVKRPATLDSIIRQANMKVNDVSLPIKATRIDLPIKHYSNGNNSVPNQKPSKKPKYTWAKASQASNFIDNVISKIRTGVYCNHATGVSTEPLYEVTEKSQPNVSSSLYPTTIQPCTTENIKMNKENDFTEVPTRTNFDLETDPLKTFGGFDETFPGLEVETISNKRVAIKNCIMNVLVHFDIAAPVGLKKSAVVDESKPSTCVPVPVTVTSDKTQIFKCTTTIVNAVLPAELCTILPNMMRNILLGPKFLPDMLPLDINKSQLSVITEISKGESHFFDALLFTSTMEWSPELQELVCGRFNPSTRIQKRRNSAFDFTHVSDLLLPRLSPSNCIPIETDFRSFCFTVNEMNRKVMKGPKCTALVPYNPPCHMLCDIPNRNHFTFAKLNKTCNLLSSIKFNYVAAKLCNEYGNIWNSHDFLPKQEKCNDRSACTALVKYVKPLRMEILERLTKTNEINKFSKSSQMKLKKKIKRKGFLRLFRRCKSTTNLTIERCATALSKITNLEEFFLALGSGTTTLCSVFDEATERKILNCIMEMKNWISEISPRQILLVLLLINKKDTPNMLKLRPLILQAIAANRITRSSELDMEVEVIERERFNKLRKCDGISYLPASCENYDSLLEELCWIAKTTASDYQKTFDDSSEKLLKSLLDKRKKLNPSYLRVMARYVGLGLLKTPK